MRLSFAILAAGVTAVAAGVVWWTVTGRPAAGKIGPVLDCPTEIDLGEQERGQVTTARFALANTGDEDLVISDVRATCSCAGLEIDEGGKYSRVGQLRLAPGERREVVVRQAINGQVGDAHKTAIHFATNVPGRSHRRDRRSSG
jgi:hypothetical protein